MGVNWKPEREVFNRFVNKELLPLKFPRMKTEKEKVHFWREIFDPHAKFKLVPLVKASKLVQKNLELK